MFQLQKYGVGQIDLTQSELQSCVDIVSDGKTTVFSVCYSKVASCSVHGLYNLTRGFIDYVLMDFIWYSFPFIHPVVQTSCAVLRTRRGLPYESDGCARRTF